MIKSRSISSPLKTPSSTNTEAKLIELVRLLAREAADQDYKRLGLRLILWTTISSIAVATMISHYTSNGIISS